MYVHPAASARVRTDGWLNTSTSSPRPRRATRTARVAASSTHPDCPVPTVHPQLPPSPWRSTVAQTHQPCPVTVDVRRRERNIGHFIPFADGISVKTPRGRHRRGPSTPPPPAAGARR